jgi:hypothetical protein
MTEKPQLLKLVKTSSQVTYDYGCHKWIGMDDGTWEVIQVSECKHECNSPPLAHEMFHLNTLMEFERLGLGTDDSPPGYGDIGTDKQSSYKPPPRRTELKWVAVDFDNTIAYSNWSPDNPDYDIGDPVPGAWDKCNELYNRGYKIIVHTARPWSNYEAIEHWLKWHMFAFSRIVCGKLLAALYVDDRAREASADSWLP